MKKIALLLALIPFLAIGCATAQKSGQCDRHAAGYTKCESCCKGTCDKCCGGKCDTCEKCAGSHCC